MDFFVIVPANQAIVVVCSLGSFEAVAWPQELKCAIILIQFYLGIGLSTFMVFSKADVARRVPIPTPYDGINSRILHHGVDHREDVKRILNTNTASFKVVVLHASHYEHCLAGLVLMSMMYQICVQRCLISCNIQSHGLLRQRVESCLKRCSILSQSYHFLRCTVLLIIWDLKSSMIFSGSCIKRMGYILAKCKINLILLNVDCVIHVTGVLRGRLVHCGALFL